MNQLKTCCAPTHHAQALMGGLDGPLVQDGRASEGSQGGQGGQAFQANDCRRVE